jgi:hypothetical protein
LGNYQLRVSKVACCESKDVVAGVHECVLPAKVGSHAFLVVRAVVFEDQPAIRVIEIGTSD